MKRLSVSILFLVVFLSLFSSLSVVPVNADSYTYWITPVLEKYYGYRGETANLTVFSNSSQPRVVILSPSNLTLYDQTWGINETRIIPIPNNASYGTYYVKVLAGESTANTWLTIFETFNWNISVPYTREWNGINYTFSKDSITAQFYEETLNIDLSTLKALVTQFGLTATATYDKNRFKVTISKLAVYVNLIFEFVESGCKFTINGNLDQPRDFIFQFENLAKIRNIAHKICVGQLFFDFEDLFKHNNVFSWNKNTKELTVSIPKTFSLDPLISFDSSSNALGEGISVSWNHTTESLSNRLLLVGTSLRNSANQTVSSVTHNGVNLSFLRADVNGLNTRTEIWYLIDPDFGTKTINATFSSSVKFVCGAITLLSINQTLPFTNNNGTFGTSTSPYVDIVSYEDVWLFGILSAKGTLSLQTFYSSVYGLLNSTTYVSGSLNDLQADDSTYMTFRSYNTVTNNLQDFIDQISNVDSHADHGTHSSFANEQSAPDTVHDTLTEADTNAGTSTWGKTSGSGASYRTTVANEVRMGVFTATSTGEVDSIIFYGRGVSTTNAKAIITDSSGNLLSNGVGSAVSISTTAGTKTLTYSAGSRPIIVSGTTYWIGFISQAAIRLYYDSTTGATSKQDTTNSYTTPTSPTDAGSTTETWRLMYANINNINYELDLEEQWVSAEYSRENEELCIKTGSLGTENLGVDVRSGSSWVTVIPSLSASQWNNVSISTYLTSGTFTIRFIGALETNDATQNTWQIDSVLLHTWTSKYSTVVEFTGTSDTETWTQLDWKIDSCFTTTDVNTIFQLYNYNSAQYPASGDGYMTGVIGTSDVNKNQTIITNPTYFRNATGGWKIRVTGTKTTITQFDWKGDNLFFKETAPVSLEIDEGADQVNYWNNCTGIETSDVYGLGSSEIMTAGVQNMSWTISSSTPWTISLVSVTIISGTVIFSDGFETNNFSAWSGTDGTVATVTTPIHTGTYSAKATGDGSDWYKTFTASADVYVRGYFRFPTVLPQYGLTNLIDIWASDYSTFIKVSYYIPYETQAAWRFEHPSAATNYNAVIAANTWYCVEMRRKTGSGTGIATLWVDGTQLGTFTSETQTVNGNKVRAGNLYTNTANFIVYGDCFVVSDTYIGLEVTEYTKTASQALTFGFSTAKALIMLRTGTKTLTFASDGERLIEVSKPASKTLTFGFATARTIATAAAASLALGFGFATATLSAFARAAAQAVAFAFSNSVLKEWLKTASQGLQFGFSGSRLIELLLNAEQALHFAFSVAGFKEFMIAVSLTVTLIAVGSRLLETQKSASQSIVFSSSTSKVIEFLKAISLSFTVSSISSKAMAFLVSAILTITLAFSSERSLIILIIASLSITFALTSATLKEWLKTASQAISFTFSSGRLTELAKTAALTITTGWAASSGFVFLVAASLAVILGFTTGLSYEFLAAASLAIILAFSIETVKEWIKSAVQTIAFSFDAAQAYVFGKAASLTVTLTSSLSGIIEYLVAAAFSFSLSSQISNLYQYFVASSLSITIQSSIATLKEWFKAASLAVTLTFNAAKGYIVEKTAELTLTFSESANRLIEVLVNASQTITFTFETLAQYIPYVPPGNNYFKNASLQISMAFDKLRQIEVVKTAEQAITFTFGSTGFLNALYLAAATLLIHFRFSLPLAPSVAGAAPLLLIGFISVPVIIFMLIILLRRR